MAPSNKKHPPSSSMEDIDPILAPLSKSNPAGISLRYEGVYDKIREARREEDPHLSQGVWQRPVKRSNFKEVEKLCIEVLTKESKDFQVMAWLIETWFELYKLKGLIKGFDICLGLCTRFWDNGYPSLQEDDVEYRIAPFHWLNEKFSSKISLISITDTSSEAKKIYTYRDWKDALERERLLQKTQDPHPEEQGLLLKTVQDSIDQTASNFYTALKNDLMTVIAKIENVEDFLLQKIPLADVSLYQLKKKLKDILAATNQILAQKEGGSVAPPNLDTEPETSSFSSSLEEAFLEKQKPLSFTKDPLDYFEKDPSEESSSEQGLNLSSSQSSNLLPLDSSFASTKQETASPINLKTLQITSREQAYMLLKIAMVFLMKTEPHSPAPYLIRRAISWGNKTLETVFQEVLEETGDLNQLISLLGIHAKNTDSNN